MKLISNSGSRDAKSSNPKRPEPNGSRSEAVRSPNGSRSEPMQYPDNPHFTEEQKRMLELAKQNKAADPDLKVLAPDAGFDHLAPPKRSAGKIALITFLIVVFVGAAGLGGWYYWWTEYATFEYELQPVVILDGHPVLPNDFLPAFELDRGVTATFQDPQFRPVQGPMAVPLRLELGLRSLEASATLYSLTPETHLTHEYRREASELSPMDLITNGSIVRGVPFDINFTEKPLPLYEYEVGEYTLRLALNGTPFEVALTVEDTTPPIATPENVVVQIGEIITPEDFVTDISDHSGIGSVVFVGENANEQSMSAMREQIVEVMITDIYGNSEIYGASLTVLKNEAPPTLVGVPFVIESQAGHPVPYPVDVAAYDDFGRAIDYYIDDAGLDTDTVDEYTVTYIAEDFTGYSTQADVTVYIIDIDPEEVNAWVDEKLEAILSDDMTREQKVRAIFNDVRKTLTSSTNLNDEWRGSVYTAAHYAINNSKGDYYHYYALSEIMLTRAEIENLRIERSELSKMKTPHMWSLVYYDGEGWYHYDSKFVSNWTSIDSIQHKFTDTQAAEIEKTMVNNRFGGEGYYHYDKPRYPDVVQEVQEE